MKYTALLLGTLILAPLGFAQDGRPDGMNDRDWAVVRHQQPSYPLDTCVVSGKPLDAMGGPLDLVKDGRLVRLCCKGCVKKLDADPAKFLAKIDEGVIAAQKASYPLETCVVSGKRLDSMGEPIEHVFGTRLVRFCCKGCVGTFAKAPERYMAEVDRALIEAQRPRYPLSTCVVSGEELGAMGEPVEFLYGTRLVRLCCKGCRKGFDKEPAKFLEKLGVQAGGAPPQAHGEGHGGAHGEGHGTEVREKAGGCCGGGQDH